MGIRSCKCAAPSRSCAPWAHACSTWPGPSLHRAAKAGVPRVAAVPIDPTAPLRLASEETLHRQTLRWEHLAPVPARKVRPTSCWTLGVPRSPAVLLLLLAGVLRPVISLLAARPPRLRAPAPPTPPRRRANQPTSHRTPRLGTAAMKMMMPNGLATRLAPSSSGCVSAVAAAV